MAVFRGMLFIEQHQYALVNNDQSSLVFPFKVTCKEPRTVTDLEVLCPNDDLQARLGDFLLHKQNLKSQNGISVRSIFTF